MKTPAGLINSKNRPRDLPCAVSHYEVTTCGNKDFFRVLSVSSFAAGDSEGRQARRFSRDWPARALVYYCGTKFGRETGERSVEELTKFESAPCPPAVGLLPRMSVYVASGLRYWEPRRILYNLALAGVVLAHFADGWPASQGKLSFDLLLGLFLLAVLANVFYCAAYLADIFVQFSGLESAWRRGRAALFIVGTAFAATIAHFIARVIFGS
jgi:hypothetical protein